MPNAPADESDPPEQDGLLGIQVIIEEEMGEGACQVHGAQQRGNERRGEGEDEEELQKP